MTDLKCAPCLDAAIAAGTEPDLTAVPDAVTMAPVMQVMNVQGRQLPMPLVVPVCVACRREQVGVPGANSTLIVS